MTVIIKCILSPFHHRTYGKKLCLEMIHNINIRHTSQISLPRFYSASFSRLFTYNTAQMYNSLHGTLKNIPLNSFRKKVKQNLLVS